MRHCAGLEWLVGVSWPECPGQGRRHAVRRARHRLHGREAVTRAARGAAARGQHHRPLQILQGVPGPGHSSILVFTNNYYVA